MSVCVRACVCVFVCVNYLTKHIAVENNRNKISLSTKIAQTEIKIN